MPITSSELEEFEGEIHLTREPLGELNKLSGYRELEIGDSSLSVVLDSLVPNYRETRSPTPLPIYQGRSVIERKGHVGEASLVEFRGEGSGKEYTWSRGLGIEFSLVKTRSARKKAEADTYYLCAYY
jgi:hypothetical protein